MGELTNLKQFPLLMGIAIQITIVFCVALLFNYVKNKVLIKAQSRLAKTANIWDDAVVSALITPSSVLVWLIAIGYSLKLLSGLITSQNLIMDSGIYIRKLGIIVIFSWFLIRCISNIEKNYFKTLDKDTTLDSASSYLIGKALRAVVIILAVISILQSIDYPLTALLTLGGASSLIIGFAAKETISNFFGGLMVYLDRPFKVGDSIKTDTNKLEGVIEKIGWRSTRIRNLDKRPVYVPNNIWVTAPVENITRMSNRRVNEIFGVRYKDADVIEFIVKDIEDVLGKHEEVDRRQPIIVRLHDFGESSLNILMNFFTKTTNFKDFLTVKQEILFKIINILRKHKADFAFPTTTIELPNYLQSGGEVQDITPE